MSGMRWATRKTLLSGVGLLAVVTGAIVWGTRPTRLPNTPLPPNEGDPRLTYATPYRNVRPEVKYVGDSACAECHQGHATAYRQHPMGRSFAPLSAVLENERFDDATNPSFYAHGMQLTAERRDSRVFHRQTHHHLDGRVAAATEREIQFVLGSGREGRTYLVHEDGQLFMSPISWYSRLGKWGMGPGYEGAFRGFQRPVRLNCLFCHANDADAVEHTYNTFKGPIFRSHAIGCERCHGPGELHVELRRQKPDLEGLDDTIVNPGGLEPALREAVCQQCHLQGATRIVRRGRQLFDYRPGLPLHLFVSVFVKPPEWTDYENSVTQPEQMSVSRCFLGSRGAGQLGCISCHNPHELPSAETRVAYYRSRCLNCHASKPCGLPIDVRRAQSREDSCIDCHMPAKASGDIAHAAVTDHRILRRRDQRPPKEAKENRPSSLSLELFYADLPGPSAEAPARDHALAVVELSAQYGEESLPAIQKALAVLERAVSDHPEDAHAGQAKAQALLRLGRRKEALETLDAILAQWPQREASLSSAAVVSLELKRYDESIAYLGRWLAVNPHHPVAHLSLAQIHLARHQWQQAEEECLAVLHRDATHSRARKLLVECYLRSGQRERAQAEYEILRAVDTQEADALRAKWPQVL